MNGLTEILLINYSISNTDSSKNRKPCTGNELKKNDVVIIIEGCKSPNTKTHEITMYTLIGTDT